MHHNQHFSGLNRIQRRALYNHITNLVGYALLMLFSVQTVHGESTLFDIDPDQSFLNSSTTLSFYSLGINVTSDAQGTVGLGTPGYSDGDRFQLDGILAADIDFDADKIVFGDSSIHALSSGSWLPAPNGSEGTTEAAAGIFFSTSPLGIEGSIAAALRDLGFDFTSFAVSPELTTPSTGVHAFDAGVLVDISATVDYRGLTGIGTFVGEDQQIFREKAGAQNDNLTGTITEIGGDQLEIYMPISARIGFSTDIDGLGLIGINIDVDGQLVGQSTMAPLDPALLEIEGNNTVFSAQDLDGLFATVYDGDVGDGAINTSALLPHITIEATGDGTFDYYAFNVSEPNSRAVFDIDRATFDSELFLFDEFGNLLASNDDASPIAGAGGTSSSLDAFLEYVIESPGRYVIGVGQYDSFGTQGGIFGTALPPGSSYTLQVTVVPEPSSLALLGIGGVFGFVHLLRRTRHRFAVGVLLGLTLAAIGSVSSLQAANLKNSLELTFDENDVNSMNYRLFIPPVAQEEDSEPLPLVLFLHGSGERGLDNFFQVDKNIDGLIDATQGSEYSAYLVAPQIPNLPRDGSSWNPNAWYDMTHEILLSVIDEYAVDESRIYITGLSMGGFGSFTYLETYPDLFAAAVPMAGAAFPDEETVETIKNIPLWMFHGTQDNVVSVESSRRMYDALVAAGGSPQLTELPNGAHDIWHEVYSDNITDQFGLYPWLFSQQLQQPSLRVVPEPSSVILALIGFFALGLITLNQRRKSSLAKRFSTE